MKDYHQNAMRLICLALLIPIFSLGNTPQALPLSLHSSIDSFIEVKPYTWIYGDPTRGLQLGEVQALWDRGAFSPQDQFQWPPYLTRGKNAWWVRTVIQNHSCDSIEAALMLYAGDSIALYDGAAPVRQCGWAYCPDEWQDALPFPAKQTFYLQWAPGETKTLYLRVCSHLGFSPVVRIDLASLDWYGDQWYAKKLPYFVVSGILAGFIGFIFLFALLQWAQTRDKTYGFYATYLLAFLLLQMSGHSADFWDINNPFYWNAYFLYILITWLLYGSYILFIDAFSNARYTAPSLHRFLMRIFGIAMGLYALAAGVYWIDIYWGWYLTLFTKVLCQLTGLGLLAVFWRQPSPLYRYLAWGMGALALFAFLAIALVFTPVAAALRARGLSTHMVGYMGVILELIFFTLGLAYKSRLAIAEREQARAENRQLQLERALENERLRTHIAQDIHDEVGGQLTRMGLASELSLRMPGLSAEDLKRRMAELGEGVRAVRSSLREVVFAINPDFDRFSEMQAYMREMAREYFQDAGIALHFDFPEPLEDPALSPELKRQLLFLYKETLQNIVRHAEAREVRISFQRLASARFRLEVRDDGKGFDPSRLPINGYNHGLSGIRKRAGSVGAEAEIISRPGEGTVVRVEGAV